MTGYKKPDATPPRLTRIETILALYQRANDGLARAEQALLNQRGTVATGLLAHVQLIVNSFAAGLNTPGDETAQHFARLYEFVSHQLTTGTLASVRAARDVMTTLHSAFAAVEQDALALERNGALPSLGQGPLVSVMC